MEVYCSKESKAKVFHLSHCKILPRVKRENRITFHSQEEARSAGYRQCDCCSVVGKRYQRERKAVDAFCEKHKLICFLFDGQLHIQAPKSTWRVIVNGRKNKLFLYHKNTFEGLTQEPSCVPGFHYQAVRRDSVLGYLETIIDHDRYREKEQKKKKAAREFCNTANSIYSRKRGQYKSGGCTRNKGRGAYTMHLNASQLYSLSRGA